MGASPTQAAALPGRELAARVRLRLNYVAVIANGSGGVLIFVFLAFLVPLSFSGDASTRLLERNLPVAIAFGLLSLPVGIVWARRRSAPWLRWLEEGREPNASERRNALHLQSNFAVVSGTMWALATALFVLLNLDAGKLVLVLGLTLALGGCTTTAVGYLLAERIARPVTARALAGGPPSGVSAPGVRLRLISAWTVATAVPVLGVVALAVDVLVDDVDPEAAAGAILFLSAVALGIGLLALTIAARSIADPLDSLRGALARVEAGDLDVEVPVDDGSEIGQLQAGFNDMAAGLRERERLRELFGRHVGAEVARMALAEGTALGGEEREVAALFVDVVGSTALAAERPPTEVVALLNRFFALVVEITHGHGGLVNKFEGDAALCVFGAPVSRPAPAGDALAAARDLATRLRAELPEVDAGIGVSAGRAVAGNIGAEERLEYTVIGDPVNEAARLCELAKRDPGRVLASDAALERAPDTERARWRLGDAVTLRGRAEPTRLATVAA